MTKLLMDEEKAIAEEVKLIGTKVESLEEVSAQLGLLRDVVSQAKEERDAMALELLRLKESRSDAQTLQSRMEEEIKELQKKSNESKQNSNTFQGNPNKSKETEGN